MAYYRNVTGVVRGKWQRIPEPNSNPFLPPEAPGENEPQRSVQAPPEWGNLTYEDLIRGNEGRFSLELSELNKNSTIQFMEAMLGVGDVNGDAVFRTKLQGVHFPLTGEVILVSATPKKYISNVSMLRLDLKDFLCYRI
jgi:hypothetical protein